MARPPPIEPAGPSLIVTFGDCRRVSNVRPAGARPRAPARPHTAHVAESKLTAQPGRAARSDVDGFIALALYARTGADCLYLLHLPQPYDPLAAGAVAADTDPTQSRARSGAPGAGARAGTRRDD